MHLRPSFDVRLTRDCLRICLLQMVDSLGSSRIDVHERCEPVWDGRPTSFSWKKKNFGTSPTEITSIFVQLAFISRPSCWSSQEPTSIFAQSKVGYSRLYFRVTRFCQISIAEFCIHTVNSARMFIVLLAHEFCTNNIRFQLAPPPSKHVNHSSGLLESIFWPSAPGSYHWTSAEQLLGSIGLRRYRLDPTLMTICPDGEFRTWPAYKDFQPDWLACRRQ